MKSLFACLALALFSLVPASLHAEDKSALVAKDGLGGLKLDLKAAEVVKLFGEPKSKEKEVLMEATGDWVEVWKYPAAGIELNMASTKKGAAKTILTISGSGPCKLATARGIKIGSTLEEVKKAYKDAESKEDSQPGESFVAGSIYGGVIFDLKVGKVTRIFIGAAAE